jgi:hypothetical protein
MSKLAALKRRIVILEKSRPEPTPWPPKPGTMSYLFYQDLGQPAERMGFMEMYLLAAERFYEA